MVVRSGLKRMSSEGTNMAGKLRAEKVRSASNRHIASVTWPDRRTGTTNTDICETFRDYFQDMFTREPSLNTAQFDDNLVEFSRYETREAGGCQCPISEPEIHELLKLVGQDKTPG